MIGRIFAAIAFGIGGAVTWVVIAILNGYGASQAGMSAGAVPAPGAAAALIPWFIASYFVVSALGVLLCRGRLALRVAALVAHSLLLIAFLCICAEGASGPSEKFLPGLLTLSFITLLWFSPGFIIWSVLLLKEERPANSAPPNGSSAPPLADSGIADGPPSES